MLIDKGKNMKKLLVLLILILIISCDDEEISQNTINSELIDGLVYYLPKTLYFRTGDEFEITFDKIDDIDYEKIELCTRDTFKFIKKQVINKSFYTGDQVVIKFEIPEFPKNGFLHILYDDILVKKSEYFHFNYHSDMGRKPEAEILDVYIKNIYSPLLEFEITTSDFYVSNSFNNKKSVYINYNSKPIEFNWEMKDSSYMFSFNLPDGSKHGNLEIVFSEYEYRPEIRYEYSLDSLLENYFYPILNPRKVWTHGDTVILDMGYEELISIYDIIYIENKSRSDIPLELLDLQDNKTGLIIGDEVTKNLLPINTNLIGLSDGQILLKIPIKFTTLTAHSSASVKITNVDFVRIRTAWYRFEGKPVLYRDSSFYNGDINHFTVNNYNLRFGYNPTNRFTFEVKENKLQSLNYYLDEPYASPSNEANLDIFNLEKFSPEISINDETIKIVINVNQLPEGSVDYEFNQTSTSSNGRDHSETSNRIIRFNDDSRLIIEIDRSFD